VLAEIQSGRFARVGVLENNAGQPSFKAMRRREAQHPIEEVGERLRAMLPWNKQNALVDKTKNRSPHPNSAPFSASIARACRGGASQMRRARSSLPRVRGRVKDRAGEG
jgi:hypothetical protein